MSHDLHKTGIGKATHYNADVDKQCRLGGCRGGNVIVVFDELLQNGTKVDQTRFREKDVILNVNGLQATFYRVTKENTLERVETD